ncbi:UNVERIFIED_CONTAM: putative amidase [Sesamum angustifolium]|uniref:Amidase n=1 Tax=Sesamum angustifolium TaxID=2727405 RepID=A0AAW2QCV5_9LAMI
MLGGSAPEECWCGDFGKDEYERVVQLPVAGYPQRVVCQSWPGKARKKDVIAPVMKFMRNICVALELGNSIYLIVIRFLVLSSDYSFYIGKALWLRLSYDLFFFCGGRIQNPYVKGGDPCGSSSGSAISVAANMVMASLGTETDGSLICPGDHNSVVAIKPTVGLTSRAVFIPLHTRQDIWLGNHICKI